MAVILEIVNGALYEDLGAAGTPVTSQQVRALNDNGQIYMIISMQKLHSLFTLETGYKTPFCK